jgi:hypothetical protein
MRKYWLTLLAFACTVAWSSMAFAQDQSLAEKLLIILKQNHQITQEQYDELLNEAHREKVAQKAAVAKQVKAQTVQAAKDYKKTHPLNVTASWKKNQIFFESNDGNFTMHVGGYAQFDFGGDTINAPLRRAIGAANRNKLGLYGAEARRVKPTLEGTLYGVSTTRCRLISGAATPTMCSRTSG